MIQVHYDSGEAGVGFSLQDTQQARIPVSRWLEVAAEHPLPAVAVLLALEQAGLAENDETSETVHLSNALVAGLEEDRARALGLPGPPPYILQIESRGALGSMRLETRWISSNGLRVLGATAKGAFLTANGGHFRLADPLYELLAAIKAFNDLSSPTAAEQAVAWGDIQDIIGITPNEVSRGSFLSRIRVARANRFTLDFVADERGAFQVAPVPLAAARPPRSGAAAIEDPTVGAEDGIDSGAIRLLSAGDQAKFQRAFSSRSEVQDAYLGGDDVYVVVTPEVREALRVVKEVQGLPVGERIAFAQNPFPRLKKTVASEDHNVPFVETRSYSDRVLGLGVLEKVILPWQILKTQGWLPPSVVEIEVGGERIQLQPEQLDPAIIDVERALAVGTECVDVGERTLPATPAVRDALLTARQRLDEQASTEKPQSSTLDAIITSQRVGLQVKRNLEATEYGARQEMRRNCEVYMPELRTSLKPHQCEALEWLQRRWGSGLRGALLADDMGLGKTLSTLSFMMWLRSEMRKGNIKDRPILIVAPVSLLENWQAEHLRHVGDAPGHFIDIVRAYGATLPRRVSGRDVNVGAATLDLDALTVDRFERPTCVLTTYETLRDYQQSFASIRFALVVLDEAQRVKNPASLNWQAVSALNADFWLALSGTPVENRLADLWAISDIIEPGFLGTLREFSAKYESEFDEAALRELKALLESDRDGAPFMLRRMKSHVLDGLPQKHEYRKANEMPPRQSSAYFEVVEGAKGVKERGQMLAVLQALRDISLNPLRPGEVAPQDYITASARFRALFEILDEVRSRNEKALIFLDRNAVEAYLAQIIQARYELPRLPSIINGEVPGKRRQQLVDNFQEHQGFAVMLLSPKAGGVGLTLTAANHVIHLSRWWNPAVEDQSTDRAYRIGQRRPVHVYYLQATLPSQPNASFDERLDALLTRKRQLSSELLWPFQGSEGDARELLGEQIS